MVTSNFIARISAIYFYCLEGFLTSTWAVNLSNIQHKLDLNDGQLGLAVLCAYLFMTLAAPISAILINYYGTKLSTLFSSLLYCISLPIIALSNSIVIVTCAFSFYGMTCGIMDTSMNSSAVLVEFVAKKAIMGSIHGTYSIAGALGSIIVGQINALGLNILSEFIPISSIFFIFSIAFGQNLYTFEEEKLIINEKEILVSQSENNSDNNKSSNNNQILNISRKVITYQKIDIDDNIEGDDDDASVISNTSVQFILDESNKRNVMIQTICLCLVGFFAAFGDTIMSTWLVIYIERYLAESRLMSSIGLSIFYVSEATGRFSCDSLRNYCGRRKLIRLAGILACIGMIIILIAPWLSPKLFAISITYMGVSLAGFGISVLYPTIISTAGHIPGLNPGTAVSTVSFCTSSGSIVGPALMGGLSVLFGSLRIALIIDVIFISLISVLSFGIRPEDIFLNNNSNHHTVNNNHNINQIEINKKDSIPSLQITTRINNNSNNSNNDKEVIKYIKINQNEQETNINGRHSITMHNNIDVTDDIIIENNNSKNPLHDFEETI